MTNPDHDINSGYGPVTQAGNVLQIAKTIVAGIDSSLIPDRDINYFDLDRKSSKGQFDSLSNTTYTFQLPKPNVPPIWVSTWILEQQPQTYEGFPNKSYFVASGLLLSNLGSLIEFKLGKYKRYTTLNEQAITNPEHIESLLGKFAAKHSIDCPTLNIQSQK